LQQLTLQPLYNSVCFLEEQRLPCHFTTVHAALALYRPIDTEKCSPIDNGSYGADSEIALSSHKRCTRLSLAWCYPKELTVEGRVSRHDRKPGKQLPGASTAGAPRSGTLEPFSVATTDIANLFTILFVYDSFLKLGSFLSGQFKGYNCL
jgi:hypothetical protein